MLVNWSCAFTFLLGVLPVSCLRDTTGFIGSLHLSSRGQRRGGRLAAEPGDDDDLDWLFDTTETFDRNSKEQKSRALGSRSLVNLRHALRRSEQNEEGRLAALSSTPNTKVGIHTAAAQLRAKRQDLAAWREKEKRDKAKAAKRGIEVLRDPDLLRGGLFEDDLRKTEEETGMGRSVGSALLDRAKEMQRIWTGEVKKETEGGPRAGYGDAGVMAGMEGGLRYDPFTPYPELVAGLHPPPPFGGPLPDGFWPQHCQDYFKACGFSIDASGRPVISSSSRVPMQDKKKKRGGGGGQEEGGDEGHYETSPPSSDMDLQIQGQTQAESMQAFELPFRARVPFKRHYLFRPRDLYGDREDESELVEEEEEEEEGEGGDGEGKGGGLDESPIFVERLDGDEKAERAGEESSPSSSVQRTELKAIQREKERQRERQRVKGHKKLLILCDINGTFCLRPGWFGTRLHGWENEIEQSDRARLGNLGFSDPLTLSRGLFGNFEQFLFMRKYWRELLTLLCFHPRVSFAFYTSISRWNLVEIVDWLGRDLFEPLSAARINSRKSTVAFLKPARQAGAEEEEGEETVSPEEEFESEWRGELVKRVGLFDSEDNKEDGLAIPYPSNHAHRNSWTPSGTSTGSLRMLRDLKRVWSVVPEFNEKNTILIDSEIRKAREWLPNLIAPPPLTMAEVLEGIDYVDFQERERALERGGRGGKKRVSRLPVLISLSDYLYKLLETFDGDDVRQYLRQQPWTLDRVRTLTPALLQEMILNPANDEGNLVRLTPEQQQRWARLVKKRRLARERKETESDIAAAVHAGEEEEEERFLEGDSEWVLGGEGGEEQREWGSLQVQLAESPNSLPSYGMGRGGGGAFDMGGDPDPDPQKIAEAAGYPVSVVSSGVGGGGEGGEFGFDSFGWSDHAGIDGSGGPSGSSFSFLPPLGGEGGMIGFSTASPRQWQDPERRGEFGTMSPDQQQKGGGYGRYSLPAPSPSLPLEVDQNSGFSSSFSSHQQGLIDRLDMFEEGDEERPSAPPVPPPSFSSLLGMNKEEGRDENWGRSSSSSASASSSSSSLAAPKGRVNGGRGRGDRINSAAVPEEETGGSSQSLPHGVSAVANGKPTPSRSAFVSAESAGGGGGEAAGGQRGSTESSVEQDAERERERELFVEALLSSSSPHSPSAGREANGSPPPSPSSSAGRGMSPDGFSQEEEEGQSTLRRRR